MHRYQPKKCNKFCAKHNIFYKIMRIFVNSEHYFENLITNYNYENFTIFSYRHYVDFYSTQLPCPKDRILYRKGLGRWYLALRIYLDCRVQRKILYLVPRVRQPYFQLQRRCRGTYQDNLLEEW